MIDELGWGGLGMYGIINVKREGGGIIIKRNARGGGEVLNECWGLGDVIIPIPHPK